VIPQRRRVVVTGIGLVSPLGHRDRNRLGVRAGGRSGIAPVSLFDASSHSVPNCRRSESFDPRDFLDQKDVKKTARFIQFAIAAANLQSPMRGCRCKKKMRNV